MILKEKTKYSCIECIRGHRSSLCKHHTRPLLQVRSKGRPNIQNNPDYRVAIFAKEVESESDIIITKSSIDYIIDYKTSEILGPYDPDQLKNSLTVNDNSFVNTTSCCSNGSRKNCGCKHVGNRTKILKNYITKNRKKFTFINSNEEAKQEALKEQIRANIQKQKPCHCGDGCTCSECMVHNDWIEPELSLKQEVESVPNVDFFADYSDECMCVDGQCNCTNCETHGIINGIKLDDIFVWI